VASFDELEQAGACVVSVFRKGITPAVMELLDKRTLEAARLGGEDVQGFDGHLLLFEVAGARKVADVEAGLIAQICRDAGAKQIEVAANEAEAKKLWSIRKTMSPALYKLRPAKIAEDVAVPVPNLSRMFTGLRKIAEKYDLLWAAYGHAGDGNVHANFLIDPEDEGEAARGQQARKELLEMVIGLGGTISGEHGVGSHKRDFIGLEISETSIEVQKAIKAALDPRNILNPGKMFPK
jgi:glycolate oxidase